MQVLYAYYIDQETGYHCSAILATEELVRLWFEKYQVPEELRIVVTYNLITSEDNLY